MQSPKIVAKGRPKGDTYYKDIASNYDTDTKAIAPTEYINHVIDPDDANIVIFDAIRRETHLNRRPIII